LIVTHHLFIETVNRNVTEREREWYTLNCRTLSSFSFQQLPMTMTSTNDEDRQ
jgi:hypothetical protein